MHQHAGFARSRPRQHQDIGLFAVVGDDSLLDRIVQVFDNAAPRSRRGLARQFLLALGQPAPHEIVAAQAEIIHRQAQRFGHRFQAALHVFGHHVNLHHLLVVMQLQWREIRLQKILPGLSQMDAHGRTEYRQALVETDHFLFVQPQQRTVEQFCGFFDASFQRDVGINRRQQLTQRGLRQQIDALLLVARHAEQMFDDHIGCSAAQCCGIFQRLPIALQRDEDRFRIHVFEADAAKAAVFIAAIAGQTANDARQFFRQGVAVPCIFQSLRGMAQLQQRTFAFLQIGSRFAHLRNQRDLQRSGFFQPPFRCIFDAGMDKSGQRGIVAGNPQFFQIVQRSADFLRTQTRHAHQFVGGNPFVGIGIEQGAHQ